MRPWTAEMVNGAKVALLSAAALTLMACSGMESMATDHGGEPPTSKPIAAISYDALFVVNGGDSSISVIDASRNEVAGTIALENVVYPHHANLSADRAQLLVAVPGMDLSMGHGGEHTHEHTHAEGEHDEAMGGAVLLLDATTGSTLAARRTGAMNHNAIFAPGGAEIWTSQMTSPGSVLVLDKASLATRQTVAVGSGPAEITFSEDGARGFVANTDEGTVTAVDAATKAVVKTIPVGAGPVGAWQGANGVAYVDSEGSKTITAIDTKMLEVKLTYDLGFTPGMAALGPDGNLWVTDTDHGKVVLEAATEDKKVGEIVTGEGAHAIAFSSDGKTAYISNQMANSVSVIDVATQKVTKTIPVGQKPNGMVFRAK